MSRGHRFFKNVSASLVGQAFVAGLGFFLTPIFIRALGLEAYGLYVLLQAATSYILLFTLGAGGATIKYAAEHATAGSRGYRDVARYSTALHVGGAAVGGLALAAAAPWAAQTLFKVPADLLKPAVFVLRCAAAGGVFVAGIQAATSILQGLQAFGAQNLVVVVQNGVMIAGAAALAVMGYGIKGVGRWNVLWSAAACAFAAVAAWRLSREPLRRGGGRPLARRAFAAYGLSLWGGSLAWVVTYQADKVVIAQAASLSALTLYAVPSGLLQRLQLLPAVVSTVLLPMFSEIDAAHREADETLRRMYLKSTRFLLFAVLPMLALLFALMPQFLGLWLGGHFSDASVWPARLLVVGHAFALLNYVPNAVAAGRGKPWWVSAVAWGQAAISVIGWSLFVKPYGLRGVALGSMLAQAVPALCYLAAVDSLLGVGWGRFLQGVWRPALSAALMLAAVFPVHHMATSWPRMILLGMLGAGVFYGSAFILLSEEDRAHVRDLRRRL